MSCDDLGTKSSIYLSYSGMMEKNGRQRLHNTGTTPRSFSEIYHRSKGTVAALGTIVNIVPRHSWIKRLENENDEKVKQNGLCHLDRQPSHHHTNGTCDHNYTNKLSKGKGFALFLTKWVQTGAAKHTHTHTKSKVGRLSNHKQTCGK